MKRLRYLLVSILLLFNLFQVNVFAINGTNYLGAKHLMSWQLSSGGWAKNMNETYDRYWNGSEKKAYYYKQDGITPLGTIDNNSTVREIEYIVQVLENMNEWRLENSVRKGFRFLIDMQYESGGFPQVYPTQDALPSLYENDATFNDNAMINVMKLFQKVVLEDPLYLDLGFDEAELNSIKNAYEQGIEFILATQIEVNGVKTVWGGQYDPITLKTTKGRPFEPVSLIGRESVEIIYFLESLNSDDERVELAIRSAKDWFCEVMIENTKYNYGNEEGSMFEYCEGMPLWYRFYEIGTNIPIFGDYDGSIKTNLSEVSFEKRVYYGWAGNWAIDIYKERVLEEKAAQKPTPIGDKYLAFGSSYIDGSEIYFIESGYDSILTPYFIGVDTGDVVRIIMTISEAEITTSNIYIRDVGFRTDRSEWLIGHGLKQRVIEFTVLEDFDTTKQFLEFEIKGGQHGEMIVVSELQILINDELKLR